MVGHPGATTVASEAWLEMPNGFVAYYVWGNTAQERGRAELFVEDPLAIRHRQNGRFRYLETGRSCITCHSQGVKAKPSNIPQLVKDGKMSEEAMRYWSTNEQLTTEYNKTRKKFVAAMTTIVKALSDVDEAFNKNLAQAGLEPMTLLVKKIDGDVPDYKTKFGYNRDITTGGDKTLPEGQNANPGNNAPSVNPGSRQPAGNAGSGPSITIGPAGLPLNASGQPTRQIQVRAGVPLMVKNQSGRPYIMHITELGCRHPNLDETIPAGAEQPVTYGGRECVPRAGTARVYWHGNDVNATSFTIRAQ